MWFRVSVKGFEFRGLEVKLEVEGFKILGFRLGFGGDGCRFIG